MEPMESIRSLDAEIVRLIFEKVRVEDRGRLAQVCSRWNAIADAPCIWADEILRLRLTHSTPTELLACVGRRAMREIKVTAMDNPIFQLPRLMQALPETRLLELAHCHNLTDDVILVTFCGPQWTLLTALDVSYCNLITDVAILFVTRQVPNLEQLCLNVCRRITDVSAGHIAANLSKLKTLEMNETLLSDKGLRLLAGAEQPGLPSGAGVVRCLENISLRTVETISDEGLYYLSLRMRHLVVLDVWLCVHLTDLAIKHIARIPTLRKLVCFRCFRLTAVTLHTLSTRPFPMEYLDVSFCHLIDTNGILSIANGQSLLGLTALRIMNLPINDHALSCLARHLTRLAFLDISGCKLITNEGIGALATYLPGLRVLVMRFTSRLRNGCLRHICRMPCLESVNLKGCRKLTGHCMRCVARGHFRPTLFELDVSSTGIGDAGVRLITEALPGLRLLSLNNCVITDKAVSLIAQRMRNLQTLNLARCKLISDRSLYMIATHLEDLRLIELNGNTRVTVDAKKNLAIAKPHLKFL